MTHSLTTEQRIALMKAAAGALKRFSVRSIAGDAGLGVELVAAFARTAVKFRLWDEAGADPNGEPTFTAAKDVGMLLNRRPTGSHGEYAQFTTLNLLRASVERLRAVNELPPSERERERRLADIESHVFIEAAHTALRARAIHEDEDSVKSKAAEVRLLIEEIAFLKSSQLTAASFKSRVSRDPTDPVLMPSGMLVWPHATRPTTSSVTWPSSIAAHLSELSNRLAKRLHSWPHATILSPKDEMPALAAFGRLMFRSAVWQTNKVARPHGDSIVVFLDAVTAGGDSASRVQEGLDRSDLAAAMVDLASLSEPDRFELYNALDVMRTAFNTLVVLFVDSSNDRSRVEALVDETSKLTVPGLWRNVVDPPRHYSQLPDTDAVYANLINEMKVLGYSDVAKMPEVRRPSWIRAFASPSLLDNANPDGLSVTCWDLAQNSAIASAAARLQMMYVPHVADESTDSRPL